MTAQPKDLHDLVDDVIEQIELDLVNSDLTAIIELLMATPRVSLEAYLSEAV